MREYYDRRAPIYEAIYGRDDPEAQRELIAITDRLRALAAGRRVLEVACGTGYWTRRYASVAASVLAIDAAPAMLVEARAKRLPAHVRFESGDAYRLDDVTGPGGGTAPGPAGATAPTPFDVAVANFWLSHVPRDRIEAFLTGLNGRLAPGATVFMADNVLVPGLGGELVTHPDRPDTFKVRTLPDGSTHEVLKNYYDAGELRAILAPHAGRLDVIVGTRYWWVEYETV